MLNPDKFYRKLRQKYDPWVTPVDQPVESVRASTQTSPVSVNSFFSAPNPKAPASYPSPAPDVKPPTSSSENSADGIFAAPAVISLATTGLKGGLRSGIAGGVGELAAQGTKDELNKLLKKFGVTGSDKESEAGRDLVKQTLGDAVGAASFAATEGFPEFAPQAALAGATYGAATSVARNFKDDVRLVEKGATKVVDFFKGL